MPIGPQLPPHLAHLSQGQSASASQGGGNGTQKTNPGPSTTSANDSDDEDDAYGPALPAHIAAARNITRDKSPSPTRKQASGPSLPFDSPSPPRIGSRRPPPPPVDDDSDDEIGPSLALASSGPSKSAAEEFREREERIAKSKANAGAEGDDGKPKREEWMLVPPTAGVLSNGEYSDSGCGLYFGLGVVRLAEI